MTWTLVYLPPFVLKWKRLGLGDDDLRALEAQIMERPHHAPVMAGTGGLRKARFAPRSWKTGKSGATRVCFAAFPEFGHLYFVTLFTKGEQDNLTPAERNAVRSLLGEIEKYLGGPRHG